MAAKLRNMQAPWVDPQDAAELDDAFFREAVPMIGDRVVSKQELAAAAEKIIRKGRPKVSNPKQALTVRYDADIVAAFKATGAGWQTRMNDALRDWLESRGVAER